MTGKVARRAVSRTGVIASPSVRTGSLLWEARRSRNNSTRKPREACGTRNVTIIDFRAIRSGSSRIRPTGTFGTGRPAPWLLLPALPRRPPSRKAEPPRKAATREVPEGGKTARSPGVPWLPGPGTTLPYPALSSRARYYPVLPCPVYPAQTGLPCPVYPGVPWCTLPSGLPCPVYPAVPCPGCTTLL